MTGWAQEGVSVPQRPHLNDKGSRRGITLFCFLLFLLVVYVLGIIEVLIDFYTKVFI